MNRKRIRCLNCDYDTSGLKASICPECGRRHDVRRFRSPLTMNELLGRSIMPGMIAGGIGAIVLAFPMWASNALLFVVLLPILPITLFLKSFGITIFAWLFPLYFPLAIATHVWLLWKWRHRVYSITLWKLGGAAFLAVASDLIGVFMLSLHMARTIDY